MAKTDIGKVRNENQDCYRVKEISDRSAIAIVCDGMGGTNGGGIASEVAINAIFDRIILSYREDMEPRSIKNLLTTAIVAANTIVYNKSREDEENRGMGTTCVAAVVRDGVIHLVSVGDSRAYLLSDSGITQITQDHNVEELLRKKGIISENESAPLNVRNIITRAVGVEETVEPDYFEISAKEDDVLLLCTDGLTNHVADEMIYSVTYRRRPESAMADLIAKANENGGKDNITAAIIVL